MTTDIDRTRHAIYPSPIGPITLVLRAGALAGVYLAEHKGRPDDAALGVRDDAAAGDVARQLDAYFAGRLEAFRVELAEVGTPFQREVWAALRTIPYGQTISYGELAALVGRPGAARAVGTANGANPVCLVVPCHRVIAADGSLGGYAGGLERKRALLELERQQVEPTRA